VTDARSSRQTIKVLRENPTPAAPLAHPAVYSSRQTIKVLRENPSPAPPITQPAVMVSRQTIKVLRGTAAVLATVQRWDEGSGTWVEEPIYTWNGSAFVQARKVWYWDGTHWVESL
jgi:hypothetical protein